MLALTGAVRRWPRHPEASDSLALTLCSLQGLSQDGAAWAARCRPKAKIARAAMVTDLFMLLPSVVARGACHGQVCALGQAQKRVRNILWMLARGARSGASIEAFPKGSFGVKGGGCAPETALEKQDWGYFGDFGLRPSPSTTWSRRSPCGASSVLWTCHQK